MQLHFGRKIYKFKILPFLIGLVRFNWKIPYFTGILWTENFKKRGRSFRWSLYELRYIKFYRSW